MDPASGSAYHVNNYLETALLSRAYFEMAEIIARCFKPKRVLEVGCAAGPTVYHLNTYFDTEAHGVDVSAWAVKNRLHPNVGQATAGKLPFPDAHFDVVFSCHTLEHLTEETVDQSIRDMTRVCSDDGVQFHLLPILGSGPYSDIFGSIVGLRKDRLITFFIVGSGGSNDGKRPIGVTRDCALVTSMTTMASSFRTASSFYRESRSRPKFAGTSRRKTLTWPGHFRTHLSGVRFQDWKFS